MNGIPTSTLALLTQCVLLALILERALTVVFADPAFARNLAKLPAVATLPGTARLPLMPRLPLRDATTLGLAYLACQYLAIGLFSSLKPGVLIPEVDVLIGALFITGLAQLLQDLLSRLRPPAPAAPPAPSSALERLRLGQNDAPAPKSDTPARFKLGFLSLKALKAPAASDN